MNVVVSDKFELGLCLGREYQQLGRMHLGIRRIDERLRAAVCDTCFDLATIAVAVYETERMGIAGRLHHGSKSDPDHEELVLSIPVLCLSLWQQELVRERLTKVLLFLTNKVWAFRFRALATKPEWAVSSPSLFDGIPDKPVRVSLWSGGLDSFAGFCDQAALNVHLNHILVSGSSSSRIAHIQRRLAKTLYQWGIRSRREIIHLQVGFGLRGGSWPSLSREPRTRAFICQALGMIAAHTSGTDGFYLYENGIGALNLPFDSTQLVSDTSRAVNPITLDLMSRLAEVIFESSFTIRNPYIFTTKSDMCSAIEHLSDEHLDIRTLISDTTSCAYFPQRKKGKAQCGMCSSCLIRKSALFVAGLQQFDSSNYACDIEACHWDSLEPRSVPVLMSKQSRSLMTLLGCDNPWWHLAQKYPQLEEAVSTLERTGLSADACRQKILRLLKRHCEDWQRFADKVRAA